MVALASPSRPAAAGADPSATGTDLRVANNPTQTSPASAALPNLYRGQAMIENAAAVTSRGAVTTKPAMTNAPATAAPVTTASATSTTTASSAATTAPSTPAANATSANTARAATTQGGSQPATATSQPEASSQKTAPDTQQQKSPEEQRLDKVIENQKKLIHGSELTIADLKKNSFLGSASGSIAANEKLLEQQREQLKTLERAKAQLTTALEQREELKKIIESLRVQGHPELAQKMEKQSQALDKIVEKIGKLNPMVTSSEYQSQIADVQRNLARVDTVLEYSIKGLEIVRTAGRVGAQMAGYAVGGSVGAAGMSFLYDMVSLSAELVSSAAVGADKKDMEEMAKSRLSSAVTEAIFSGLAGGAGEIGKVIGSEMGKKFASEWMKFGVQGTSYVLAGVAEGLSKYQLDAMQLKAQFERECKEKNLTAEQREVAYKDFAERNHLTWGGMAAKVAEFATQRAVAGMGGEC